MKRKDVPFRSRNRLLRNKLVSICFKNFKSQNGTPNWQNFQNVENTSSLLSYFSSPLKLGNRSLVYLVEDTLPFFMSTKQPLCDK